MGSDTSPVGPRPLRVSIELLPGSAPITGQVTDAAGNVAAFTGWLGLMAELEAALTRPADEPDPALES